MVPPPCGVACASAACDNLAVFAQGCGIPSNVRIGSKLSPILECKKSHLYMKLTRQRTATKVAEIPLRHEQKGRPLPAHNLQKLWRVSSESLTRTAMDFWISMKSVHHPTHPPTSRCLTFSSLPSLSLLPSARPNLAPFLPPRSQVRLLCKSLGVVISESDAEEVLASMENAASLDGQVSCDEFVEW